MSKKHFIALANVIREHNIKLDSIFGINGQRMRFSIEAIDQLANFCQAQNPQFNRDRWIDYINGECGPSGGKIQS